jgi:hypothetical protein
MAIGDYGNNNTNNSSRSNGGIYEPSYYSRYRFRNDNKNLSFTFRSGLLCIEIGEYESTEGFKVVPKEKIYLSPIKAIMLSEQIKAFIDYRDNTKKIDSKKAFGVNAGMNEKVSYIGISTNDDKENIITIGKFDQNGVITESDQFKFIKDYNYALDWNDITSNDLSKVYKNDVELMMFYNTLVDFGRAMSGATGYGVADVARYDSAREHNRMDMVLDKLGIERRSNVNNYNPQPNNYLNNASSSSRSTTVDDIESLLMD